MHDRRGILHGTDPHSIAVLASPQTIAACYAVLSHLILAFSSRLHEVRLLSKSEIDAIMSTALEANTLPCRFGADTRVLLGEFRAVEDQPEP